MALHPASKARLQQPSPIDDPRLGAVVVAGHNPQWTVGQVVDVTPPEERQSAIFEQ